MLDGTVQPMDQPERNLEDTHLNRALDELARLVEAPVQMVSTKPSNEEGEEAENQIPQPLPEPIPIEVPLPPTPVIVQAPTHAVLATTENGSLVNGNLMSELAALSAGAPPVELEPPSPPVPQAPRIERRTPGSPLLLAGLALVMFITGMLTERFTRLFEGRASTTSTTEKKPVVDNLLSGRITYKTKEGESQPDRGARILVFPQTRSGQIKLSVVGFRPADGPEDQAVANATLKALGGAAATVSEDGRYQLPIEAGTYRVLVLSHYQPRDDSPAEPDLDKLLNEYFDKPAELLGKIQFRFAPLRVKGTGDIWDHSF